MNSWLGPEYRLVLLMPFAFAGLACGAGKQRDKVAAYAGEFYLRDTHETPNYVPAVNAPIHSLLLTPLKTTERVMEVLTFESQAVDDFSVEEVAALTALSDRRRLRHGMHVCSMMCNMSGDGWARSCIARAMWYC